MDNRYYKLFENLIDGFVYCKLVYNKFGKPSDFIFLEANKAFIKMFKVSKDKILNKRVAEVFCSLDSSIFDLVELGSYVALNGNGLKLQKYSSLNNRWYLISIFSCETGYFAATYQDITDLKKSEEEQFRFSKLANEMYSIFDLAGNFIDISPTWEKVLGYSRDEMLNMHFSCFIHPDDLLNSMEVVRRKIVDGESMQDFRNRYKCKDGSYKWLSWNSDFFPSEGLIYNTSSDITELMQYEERLNQTEEGYRVLVDSSPYGILIVEDTTIKFVNKATLQLAAAASVEDLVNKSIYDFIPLDHHRLVKRRLKGIFNSLGKRNIIGELTLINYAGTFLDYEITSLRMPCYSSNTMMLIIRDITSRRQVEELKVYLEEKLKSLEKVIEYDRLKTEFFSNISHEFKTPLNVILGTLQLLKLYLQHDIVQVDSKLEKKFDIMKQNCYRLLRLVNNFIDITRIEAGYYDIKLANYDIVAIINAIVFSVKDYIEGKGIIFSFNTNTTSKMIACDPDKIERIFLNLISNAIKFTMPGGRIDVSVALEDDRVLVSVKDTGVGIPKDKRDKIFDRFTQFDKKTLTKSYEGSGIGLSLVESLVRMHNGKISVKSQEGEGSEFIVELPYVTIPEEAEMVLETAASFDCPVEHINIEFSDIYLSYNK